MRLLPLPQDSNRLDGRVSNDYYQMIVVTTLTPSTYICLSMFLDIIFQIHILQVAHSVRRGTLPLFVWYFITFFRRGSKQVICAR